MHRVYGYLRVSTTKQGTQGVSLQEQREAVERYSSRNDLTVVEWFVEQQTAAKRGRPVFTRMLSQLKAGAAHGVVMHKIDRSARNLRDWADLGELIDGGIAVHFANESLDLHSRGGRLSADIQAVIAADFIRNLREETRKGFYGRLKQGLYPIAAPIGYLDQGRGQPKIPDPDRAPLVRKAFEFYDTGTFTLDTLGRRLGELGLRNRNGGPVTRNGLSVILNNPFYMGLIRIRRTGEVFSGVHDPLISKRLFDRVQDRLAGRVSDRRIKHEHLFRRLLKCGTCGRSLIGERQKGHVYYRCHSGECGGTSLREERVDSKVRRLLDLIELTDDELASMQARLGLFKHNAAQHKESFLKTLRMNRERVTRRLDRVTDAYLDGTIEKIEFDRRKERLLLEQKALDDDIRDLQSDRRSATSQAEEIVELLKSAKTQYIFGNADEKREVVRLVMSNPTVFGKELVIEPRSPYAELANRPKIESGDPSRDAGRTFHESSMVCESRAEYAFNVIRDHCERKLEEEKALRQKNRIDDSRNEGLPHAA